MRLKNILLAAALTMMSAGALAETSAQRCLAYGKQVMKDNPEILRVLHQVVINDDDVTENVYDANVGKQHIATEVVINAHSNQEVLGKIVCLLDNDAPLYFTFILADSQNK